MPYATCDNHATPMGDMNTTPLIDVLLVLLIMFIITIPVATHEVDIQLPVPDRRTDPPPPLNLAQNKVVIDMNDRLFWNAQPIDERQMQALLAQTRLLAVEPELQFEPVAGASYGRAAYILKLIKSSGISKFGFVGNEKYRALGGNAAS